MSPFSHATARQLHGGPAVGFAAITGTSGGYAGVIALNGGYGLNDTWRLYANAQYVLGAGDMRNTPMQAGSLSAGIAYTLDVVSVLPWAGIGFSGAIHATPAFFGIVPAAEARIGVDYLASRYFGLTFQASYAFALLNRETAGDTITALLGLRWSVDL